MRGFVVGGGLLGLVLVVAIIGYLLVGTGGSPSTSSSPEKATGGGYVGTLLQARDTAGATAALVSVRQRIDYFRVVHGRLPVSLEELAAGEPLPSLPEGMRYRYDPPTGKVEAEFEGKPPPK